MATGPAGNRSRIRLIVHRYFKKSRLPGDLFAFRILYPYFRTEKSEDKEDLENEEGIDGTGNDFGPQRQYGRTGGRHDQWFERHD